MRKAFLGKAWRTRLIFGISVLTCVSGCASKVGYRQLENVAKDWCYAIRALQVMPVYPLTEDLRPGDVFLVQTTLQGQARIWEERGFLPLDDHRTRLSKVDYSQMYFNSYWKDEFGGRNIPHPRPALANHGSVSPSDNKVQASSNVEAPRAAFPTYSFEANVSNGFSLAMPVHSVPVALNFMNASKAIGSITITDAYTYSADPQQLYKALEDWADADEVRMMLREAYRQVDHVVYLRVVTRVYLTGVVAISLTNASRNAGNVKAGAEVGVPLIAENGTLNNDEYSKLIQELDKQANIAFPVNQAGKLNAGGGVKFSFASRRAVSMSQAFDRPLAIGFLGFDVPVDKYGNIGSPLPSFQNIKGDVVDSGEQTMNNLKPLESEANIRLFSLDGVFSRGSGSHKAACVIAKVSEEIDANIFADPIKMAKKALGKKNSDSEVVKRALEDFDSTLRWYLAKGAGAGKRYERFITLFDKAFNQCIKE
nr:hypothetical protein [uncultured Desulfobulbus sp.]